MHRELPLICILAGGLGTRLASIAADTPKPLLEVAGEPFLIHQLRLLAGRGARRVVLCVGYLGEQIEQRIGREQFGIEIAYSHDGPVPIGTLGAIRRAAPMLGERYLVLYGDTYLRIDYGAAARAWIASTRPAMMTVLRNDGRWDTSNVSFDGTSVIAYEKSAPDPSMEWIDYGLGGLTAAALTRAGPDISDLSELYRLLAHDGQLFGFAATERFYEIGTPEALVDTAAFLDRLNH